jgi:hypothetical protein
MDATLHIQMDLSHVIVGFAVTQGFGCGLQMLTRNP